MGLESLFVLLEKKKKKHASILVDLREGFSAHGKMYLRNT